MKPGDDVWVAFEGADWPGEVLKVETSGYVRCRIHVDPEWDFGCASARFMSEQTVAVRATHIRARKLFHRIGECGDVCSQCELHPERLCGDDCSGCVRPGEGG